MPSITITFNAESATRIAAAFQEVFNLPAPATAQEVKDYVITDLKQVVRTSEKRVAEAAANPNPGDVDLT